MILKIKLECHKLRPFLWDYAATRLPEERMEQLEAHIARCPRCSSELAEYRSAQKLIARGRGERLPEPTLDWVGLRTVLEELPSPLQMISQPQPKQGYRSGPLLWSAVGGTAAAAIMLLIAKPQSVPVHYHTVHVVPQKVAIVPESKGVVQPKSYKPEPKVVTRVIEVATHTAVPRHPVQHASQAARQGFEDATLALIANITPPAKTSGGRKAVTKSVPHNPAPAANREVPQIRSNANDLPQNATLISASADGGDAHYVMSALQPDPYGPDTPY